MSLFDSIHQLFPQLSEEEVKDLLKKAISEHEKKKEERK